MSSYFGRNYLLTITPVSGDELTYQPPLEIRFAVDNTPQNVDATARITLYGISARTRALIQRYDDKEKRYGNLVLKAGYGDNIGTIFSGRIHNVEVVKEGVNTCLRLYCRTIGLAWNTTIFKTWGANTPAIEMLKDVA
ncbi:baseplate hub protein, partial [Yersinia enterocolitica]